MWHRRARHCLLCGDRLIRGPREGRSRLHCVSCEYVLYANPACASAGLVMDARGYILLVLRAIPPYKGLWALPAGYQEMDEDPRQAVEREILEETGLQVVAAQLIDLIFVREDDRKPANVAVFLCEPRGGELAPGHDAAEVAWFSPDALPPDLGFDNGPRIRDWLRSLE